MTCEDYSEDHGAYDAARVETTLNVSTEESLANRVARRILDLGGSLVVLLVTLPLMLVIAVAIKLDSPGPALFRHARIGINRRRGNSGPYQGPERRRRNSFGKPFVLYKFRTMYADSRERFPSLYTYAYSDEELFSLPIKSLVGPKKKVRRFDTNVETQPHLIDDPRITRVGRWLRMTSLDELPNFFNVLKADMHLVGPRADIAENIRYYAERHRVKLTVKPGVTGLAQINGRGWLSFVETNERDVEYVRRRSLALDLKILMKTFASLFNGHGAF